MPADGIGLTGGLSGALSRPEVTRDPGVVLRDVAVSIAGGAQNLAGTAVLRDRKIKLHRRVRNARSPPGLLRQQTLG